MGRGEAFIFLATLLKAYSFEKPVDNPEPKEEVFWGLARVPKPYYVRIVKRKSRFE